MGLFSIIFGRSRQQPSAAPAPLFDGQTELLKTLLELERFRLERTAEIDAKRAEIELKKEQLQLADLERIGQEKRKQELFAEELKKRRREQAAHARAARDARKNGSPGALPGQIGMFKCEECQALAEGRPPKHSHDLIRHKHENHTALVAAAAN